MAASYTGASAIVGGVRPRTGDVVRAIADRLDRLCAGSLPDPPLRAACRRLARARRARGPVLVIERLRRRRRLRRAIQLARADYVHALASLATLVILFGLVKLTLVLLLRDLGDSGRASRARARRPRHVAAALPRGRPPLRRPGRQSTIGPRDRGGAMPTYLMLTKLTPQGVQTLKANPAGCAR